MLNTHQYSNLVAILNAGGIALPASTKGLLVIYHLADAGLVEIDRQGYVFVTAKGCKAVNEFEVNAQERELAVAIFAGGVR